MYAYGYKVVYVDRKGELQSATTGGVRVTYSTKEHVERPRDCGSLAVFKDLASARTFKDGFLFYGGKYHLIFRCEYVPAPKEWRFLGTFIDSILPESKCPPGTEFALSVKLLWDVDALSE